MMQGPELRVGSSPSVPPRGITWPMVAYALVRELTSSLMVIGGVAVAIVLAMRAEPSMLHVLGAVVGPSMLAALQRSKPAESIDFARFGVNPYRE